MIYTTALSERFHSIVPGENWARNPESDVYNPPRRFIGGTVVYKRDLNQGRIVRTGDYYEVVSSEYDPLLCKSEAAYIIGVDVFDASHMYGGHVDIELTDFLEHWHHDEDIAKVPPEPVDWKRVFKPFARIFYLLMMCLYWPIAGPLLVVSMFGITPIAGLFSYIFTGEHHMGDICEHMIKAFFWFPYELDPDD